MLYWWIFLLCCFCLYPCSNATKTSEHGHKIIQIKGSGFFPVKQRQVALILYIDLYNFRSKPVYVNVTVGRCCFYSSDGKTDCLVMRILGSYSGKIGSKESYHLNFIYPTKYPYDLLGGCDIRVKSDRKYKTQRHVILFNTTLLNTVSPSNNKFWDYIRDMFYGTPPLSCINEDEDKYNNCKPVNCILKYHGQRNYFDSRERKCIPVPTCKEQQGYDEATNTCKHLDRKFTHGSEINSATSNRIHSLEAFDWRKTRINCNHGRKTVDGFGCICNPGWFTVPVDFAEVNPHIFIFNLCDQRRHDGWMLNIDSALVGTGIFCGLLVITLIVFYVVRIMKTRSSHTDYRGFDICTCISFKTPSFLRRGYDKIKGSMNGGTKCKDLESASLELFPKSEGNDMVQDYELD